MAEGLGRKCIFCEGEPVTREHLWPQWLAEVVPADAAIECSHTWQRGTSEPTEFAQRPFQLTVRAVCENCNGGWMSAIENETKHLASGMIQGRARVLHKEGQRTLAVWAALKAMMFACTAPELPLRRGLFSRMLEDPGEPPPRTYVWVARADGENPAFWSASGLVAGEEEASGAYPPLYISTLSVNHLVVQALFNNGEEDLALMHGGDIAAGMQQIWPIENGTVTAASGPSFTNRGLRRVASVGRRKRI